MYERKQVSRAQFRYGASGHGGHGVLLPTQGVKAGFTSVKPGS
jgi:hypothetical protein